MGPHHRDRHRLGGRLGVLAASFGVLGPRAQSAAAPVIFAGVTFFNTLIVGYLLPALGAWLLARRRARVAAWGSANAKQNEALREVVWVILADFRRAVFCCCFRCGHVGNALALSIMSTAMSAGPRAR